MKKTYIIPSTDVVETELTVMIAQSGGKLPDGGNGSVGFGDAGDGDVGEDADVKRSFNVWSDDWSR